MAPLQPACVLEAAARFASVDTTDAVLLRDGSHAMYQLHGGIVARVGRPGTIQTAEREVAASRWLADVGFPVTHALTDLPQPVVIGDRPVTWWQLIPKHRPATPAELGRLLCALHSLPIPESLQLPPFDPFIELDQAISDTSVLSSGERAWLVDHVSELRMRYRRMSLCESRCVIHGDAWQGNVAVLEDSSPILLDLERIAIGRSDWDLVPIAVDHTDFARIDVEAYQAFVCAYGGYDVTTTSDFRTLAEIQELRWVRFAIAKAADSSAAGREARHRIACLRGEIPRPWSWTAL